VKDIIIPKANVRDLDDIPAHVRKGIDFHPVSRMEDVIEFAFSSRGGKSKKVAVPPAVAPAMTPAKKDKPAKADKTARAIKPAKSTAVKTAKAGRPAKESAVKPARRGRPPKAKK
jgi:ATP-dependent Lon protease